MLSLPSLPRALLVLLFLVAVPTLSESVSLPKSTNDPFRAIAVVQRARQPEAPLCCLKPSPSLDPPEGPEDVLLSFEEWKSKQLQSHSQNPALATAQARVQSPEGDEGAPTNDIPSVPVDASVPEPSYPQDTLPPHFRVPITDRFNYANMDCSARVHTSHKSAKSPSNILSSKKDKYMLSPCSTKNGEEHFVVVELCEDIRIDTVQLANFEFFSGVFKDFTVRVAKTYTATDEGWTLAGTYRARNVRGVQVCRDAFIGDSFTDEGNQSFHPPTSLRDFYRYIRIDFHSHYGHEYYCPVSLLRVYGLTHLEQWKWDMWEAESRERLQNSGSRKHLIAETSAASASQTSYVSADAISAFMDKLGSGPIHTSVALGVAKEVPPESLSSTGRGASGPSSQHRANRSTPVSSSYVVHEVVVDSVDVGENIRATPVTVTSSVITEAMSSLASLMDGTSTPTQSTGEYVHLHTSDIPCVPTSPVVLSTQTHPQTQQPVIHASTLSPLPPLQAQSGGESIYRTIMNRLTVLEANHTLYARYVEEQTASVREVLRKLSEEVGRLESIGRMQAQMYQRTVHEWERQRLRLELEHGELLSRVNYLADEASTTLVVVIEKRLGIAQLCILLAVLVFMGLTRGAPSVVHPQTVLNRSMREWGVRNLSFGSSREGSWNPLRLRSRSPTVQSTSTRAVNTTGTENAVAFPAPVLTAAPKPHPSNATSSPRHTPKASKSSSTTTTSLNKRSHTPSSFRTPTRHRPLVSLDPQTLPKAQPITRSNSSILSAHPNSRSTKRWARTAHLHEVKVARSRRDSGSRKRTTRNEEERENENGVIDVFRVPVSSSEPQDMQFLATLRRNSRPSFDIARTPGEESADADAWIDTDAEGSEAGSEIASGNALVLDSPETLGR
ncbi:UNC-like C-terminal-domain-containing protein [Phlebopus sp. FC_14]|nr:UNC-like C-terminal-domain-containing protein [Phlebopus sp. FC_14]